MIKSWTMIKSRTKSRTKSRAKSRTVSRALILFAALAALVLPATALNAQPGQPKVASAPPVNKGPPNALQGFSQNRDQPVHIEAASLEVRDKDKVATFSGDVKVQQGDTGLRCKSLVVFYEQDAKDGAPAPNTMPAATAGPGGEQRIKRLEAKGGVVVTQKEQTATGELGIFDMKTNTVTLTGNVIMTQGKNILRGDKLVVDLTSGVSRVESGKNASGRVQMLLQPGSGGPIDMPGGGQSPLQSNRP